jgi:hypothetical protein
MNIEFNVEFGEPGPGTVKFRLPTVFLKPGTAMKLTKKLATKLHGAASRSQKERTCLEITNYKIQITNYKLQTR